MRTLITNRLFRYIIAGGLSYLIEITAIFLFIYFAGIDDLTSVAIAFWIGLSVSFLLQKLFAFSNKTTKKKTTQQIVLYAGLVMVNYAFTLVFVAIFSPIFGVAIARTVALAITTGWNFIVYSRLIFKHSDAI